MGIQIRTMLLVLFLSSSLIALSFQKPTILGASPQSGVKYTAKIFACSDELVIPSTFVNDDFCDCPDGSDEPGTSTCEFQFWCANHNLLGHNIPSSRVNDRVCDCCDGSDEKQTGVCADTCDQEAESVKQNFAERYYAVKTGLTIKYESIQNAKKWKDQNKDKLQNLKRKLNAHRTATQIAKNLHDILSKQHSFPFPVYKLSRELQNVETEVKELEDKISRNYGVNNEYYYLEDKCVTTEEMLNFKYEICFFGRATQEEKGNGAQSTIGRFKEFSADYKEMKFLNGDGCHVKGARELIVELLCGDVDQIVKVWEPEMCRYRAQFKTAAACTKDDITKIFQI